MSHPTPPSGSGFSRLAAVGVAAVLLAAALAAPVQGQEASQLAQVEALLERDDADAALSQLRNLMKKGKPSAEAYLLRSTAYVMKGELAKAFDDLHKALAADPALRQAWLNLAGLEIAQQAYSAAYDALVKARDLDPKNSDNHLNLGAVVVLQRQLEEAKRHFDAYLAANPESAEAAYLVASNYALAGYEAHAVDALRLAFRIDERMRLKARADERFLGLQEDSYRQLLNTDFYQPPADHRTAAAAFREIYQRSEPKLVYAVLDALKHRGQYYDPNVETSDHWALVWGEMRIKISNQDDDTGVVRLSAPPDRFTAGEWERATRELFESIYDKVEELFLRTLKTPADPP